MVLADMLPEVGVRSEIGVNIIGDASGDLSFLVDAIHFPASLLEHEILTKPALTGMACRLSHMSGPSWSQGHRWSQRSDGYHGQNCDQDGGNRH